MSDAKLPVPMLPRLHLPHLHSLPLLFLPWFFFPLPLPLPLSLLLSHPCMPSCPVRSKEEILPVLLLRTLCLLALMDNNTACTVSMPFNAELSKCPTLLHPMAIFVWLTEEPILVLPDHKCISSRWILENMWMLLVQAMTLIAMLDLPVGTYHAVLTTANSGEHVIGVFNNYVG